MKPAANRILLGVNIDHVATLRQARGTHYPEPLDAAFIAEKAGADSITVHLREDRRHIQDRDVSLLKQASHLPLNLEMAVTDEMLAIACNIQPDYCCLVPEKREELTTEGGLDVAAQQAAVQAACSRLAEAGIVSSLFIDPDAEQIQAAAACGAHAIELHTGSYADATNAESQSHELRRIHKAAQLAAEAGLRVHAGHGLHYQNVQAVAAIPEIVELNIGHAIIARAVLSGLHGAVADMKKEMLAARV